MKPWLELREIAAGCGAGLPKPGAGAARQSAGGARAHLVSDGWHLVGEKPFCSGSTCIDRALVTAECTDGYRLLDVSVAENVVAVRPNSWPAVGMADSLSETLEFGGPAVPTTRAVGLPGFYLERPGFWFGGTGVAACWYGGARGLVSGVAHSVGPHSSEAVQAELGHAAAHLEVMRWALERAADEIDNDPKDVAGTARRRALLVRHAVHHAAQQVMVHTAAAGGARLLCHDPEQARRAADLYVYLAQHHGPQDAHTLGRMAWEGWPWG
jgi:alkylation response protein AidB-like acyl-CoA dehydrogenase